MNVISNQLEIAGEFADDAAVILSAALRAVDPEEAVRSALVRLDLNRFAGFGRQTGLISLGKAAIPMARGFLDVYDGMVRSGLLVTKVLPDGKETLLEEMNILQGNHPVPGPDSIHAGNEVLQYATRFGTGDVLFCLISGGASSLVCYPYSPVTLDDMQLITKQLLDCGANIDEMNAVRKHIDGIKGGKLAASCGAATCISLVLSDVLGDRLDVIASGPTVPDESTYQDAWDVLGKYRLLKSTPPAILKHLQKGIAGEIMETPKPGDAIFTNNHTVIVGSLEIAITAARNMAELKGYSTEFLPPLLTGEARKEGERLAGFLRSKANDRREGVRKRCWIAGGETTVTITGNGMGGRNQELALAAVKGLDGVKGAVLITFATDGEDGRSPAAGAVVTGDLMRKASALGLDPDSYLRENDSHTFFNALNAAIMTGSTGTNVNDLVIMLLD